MMIDFALEAERTQAMTPHAAIRQACLLRLRPILMTTMAALLGALPLMLGGGVGSELRHPLGISMVGGAASPAPPSLAPPSLAAPLLLPHPAATAATSTTIA